ncbi:MAG: hypothetical protein ACD_59C00053G0003 [uncultured bacterium]|nr:MAG: hypothetical protein ACD_59C00053G0003 [uncultured bacterium]
MDILFFIISCALAYLAIKQYIKIREYTSKYSPLINLDDEINKKCSEFNALKNEVTENAIVQKNLMRDISILQETLEIYSYGLYEPNLDSISSLKYKEKLESIYEQQKALIKNHAAAHCSVEWTVNGDKKAGKKQTKDYLKLMLRAFNGECDAIIGKVKWNNVVTMEERMKKSFSAINDMASVHLANLSKEYLELKLQELWTTHKYQEKTYQEKEEQRKIQEQIREEERAQKEYEKAIRDAAKEEEGLKKMMEKVKAEVDLATADQKAKYEAKLKDIEIKLKEAETKSQRALSMAQQTKAGHVYVISNIGSFGENVYKIGLTRRLEPVDRVKELGDASVPFPFDVHAMIYSENAPALETELHKKFLTRQINKVNPRKEFFNVNLNEVGELVNKMGHDINFTLMAEAREYRETLALENSMKNKTFNESDWVSNQIKSHAADFERGE